MTAKEKARRDKRDKRDKPAGLAAPLAARLSDCAVRFLLGAVLSGAEIQGGHALFGLALKWGIFWVYIGITMEQVSKFGFGVGRFRSRAWINDVTVARYQREETPSRSADT